MPDDIRILPLLGCCDTESGLLPLAAARARLLDQASPVHGEDVLTPTSALGRVLAAPPRAAIALPPFDQSAMDGYGLHAEDLAAGAAPRLSRRITAGEAPGAAIEPGEAVRILTGAPVPAGVAAVAMEEHVVLRDGRVRARHLPGSGDNIRRRGEDVAEGEALVPAGTRLDARHLALLVAAGALTVRVRRRVRVALLSNGNELGRFIHDSNRPMLRALLAAPGITCTDLGVLPDDPEVLARVLGDAAMDHDLILASGGISGSDADHLPHALAAAGGAVSVLKLALKPGKPLAHGRLGNALCLFLPGNPLAALVTMLVLGRPLLARLAGAAEAGVPPIAAIAAERFTRKPGREEFMPARIIGHDAQGLPALLPLGRGGSARLMPLSQADGLLWLPAAAERVEPGDALRFHSFAASFGLG